MSIRRILGLLFDHAITKFFAWLRERLFGKIKSRRSLPEEDSKLEQPWPEYPPCGCYKKLATVSCQLSYEAGFRSLNWARDGLVNETPIQKAVKWNHNDTVDVLVKRHPQPLLYTIKNNVFILPNIL